MKRATRKARDQVNGLTRDHRRALWAYERAATNPGDARRAKRWANKLMAFLRVQQPRTAIATAKSRNLLLRLCLKAVRKS